MRAHAAPAAADGRRGTQAFLCVLVERKVVTGRFAEGCKTHKGPKALPNLGTVVKAQNNPALCAALHAKYAELMKRMRK